ncbi:MAG: hypothetical protein ABSB60_18915 [Terracidiphilus sp.]|jgi:hypothetical protein
MLRFVNGSWRKVIIGCAGNLALICFPALLWAGSITGTVRNLTLGGPAAGDKVILLGVGPNAEEEARATTDSQGAFALGVPHPDVAHLVRVIHQGVTYDRQISAGDVITIDVADASVKVNGITGGIEIIRTGTHGNLLHVSDMVEIRNLSNPPVTQAGGRSFEVFLPSGAKIDSVLAAGPENIGAMIPATPVRDVPGHYSVSFPLRPGATKFAFNYEVPYDGHISFRTRNIYPLQQLAVMIPPTMTFASRSPRFQLLAVGQDKYKVEAAEGLKAEAGLDFEISGAGALPRLQPQAHAPPNPTVNAPAVPSVAMSGNIEKQTQGANALRSVAAVGASATPSQSQWRLLYVGAAFMLGLGGFIVLRSKKRAPIYAVENAAYATGQAGLRSAFLVEALKEGLFLLEADMVQGAISKRDYASVKLALEGTIEWAVTRTGTRRGPAIVRAMQDRRK